MSLLNPLIANVLSTANINNIAAIHTQFTGYLTIINTISSITLVAKSDVSGHNKLILLRQPIRSFIIYYIYSPCPFSQRNHSP